MILDFEAFFCLGVKGVELKLVSAFERFRVNLFKSNPVELTLKDVDFLMYQIKYMAKSKAFLGRINLSNLNNVVGAANIVALPC